MKIQNQIKGGSLPNKWDLFNFRDKKVINHSSHTYNTEIVGEMWRMQGQYSNFRRMLNDWEIEKLTEQLNTKQLGLCQGTTEREGLNRAPDVTYAVKIQSLIAKCLYTVVSLLKCCNYFQVQLDQVVYPKNYN